MAALEIALFSETKAATQQRLQLSRTCKLLQLLTLQGARQPMR